MSLPLLPLYFLSNMDIICLTLARLFTVRVRDLASKKDRPFNCTYSRVRKNVNCYLSIPFIIKLKKKGRCKFTYSPLSCDSKTLKVLCINYILDM